jgi:hypothetical protein
MPAEAKEQAEAVKLISFEVDAETHRAFAERAYLLGQLRPTVGRAAVQHFLKLSDRDQRRIVAAHIAAADQSGEDAEG